MVAVSILTPKRALFAEFAAVARALGNEHRLDLLEHLAQGERSVEALAARTGIPFASVSQHLQALRKAGLVAARREARRVVYRIADDAVIRLVASLREVAEHQVAAVDRIVSRYFHDRDSMEPVAKDELLSRMRDGIVTVLDVRPQDEFASGHLPGAINIPLSELRKRLGEFVSGQEVVAYCRGPWCVLAFEAVALLRQEGLSARRLDGGLPEWKIAGLPVDTAPSVRASA
jgi:rhodanese-related sulfurtransferase/DNA-binding transcriptional ArsR family regulator